jgi:hypothetical protein
MPIDGSMNKDTLMAKFIISLASSSCSAGRIARELWCTNQKFFPVDIIPPWFSMLSYHLGNEQ